MVEVIQTSDIFLVRLRREGKAMWAGVIIRKIFDKSGEQRGGRDEERRSRRGLKKLIMLLIYFSTIRRSH